MERIIVADGNPVYDSRESCNAIIRTEDNVLIVGCKSTLIPNSVTSLGDGAFYNCSGLTEVTIPSSVTSISDHAFNGCISLTSVYIHHCLATTPPSCNTYAFYGIDKSTCTLSVPQGCTSAYQQADGWKEFLLINEDATGINAVSTDKPSGVEVIYTINGMKLNTTNTNNLPTGIYLINGKKVYVK